MAKELMTQDEVLLKEDDLLEGLLAAVSDIEQTEQKVKIARKGKTFFEFRIRPLSEPEVKACIKAATKYVKNPMGRHLPKVEGETDWAIYKSKKIYAATVEEDREKLWDNPIFMKKLDVMLPEEVIDKALLLGEKNVVVDLIDQISGYKEDGEDDDDVSVEDYAKN